MKSIMKNFVQFILLLLITSFINAQSNLVLNPSFEQYDECKNIDLGIIDFGKVNFWNTPGLCSSDYYNACIVNNDSGNFIGCSVPLNSTGFEYPYSGNAYVGIVNGINIPGDFFSSECIQGTIRDSLKIAHKYILKFYISLAEYQDRYGCFDNIDVYFSDTSINLGTILFPIPLIPHFSNPTGNIFNKKIGWQKVEGTYTAHGGERKIIIGNFNTRTSNHIYDCKGLGITTSDYYSNYIYIDDVSLIDTSIIDTINLCFNDSIQIGEIYAKTTGMYFDTVEGIVARTYVQMRPQYGSLQIIDVPYHRGDTIQIGMRQFCYSDTVRAPFVYCDSLVSGSCFKIQYLWPTPDTFIDEKYTNVFGCDSTVRYILRTNVGINSPQAYTQGVITIYPNPANELINLQIKFPKIYNENTSDLNIEITDALGRNITTQAKLNSQNSGQYSQNKEQNYKFDISNLSSGFYFIKVLNKNQLVGNSRFIKE